MKLFQLIKLAAVALHVMAAYTFGGPFSDVFAERERAAIIEREDAVEPASAALPPLSIDFDSTIAVSEQNSTYDVELHTTTGCLPCEKMKASLAASNRLRVTTSVNSIPPSVPAKSFPFITFRDANGKLWYHLTARTADEVVRIIEKTRGVASQGTSTRRLTASELRSFARTYRGPRVDVQDQTVYRHLQDANHRFTSDQLAGLTNNELHAIHSAHHNKHISPVETVTAPTVAARAVGGTIHGREQIAAAFSFIRARVGEGVPMRFEWDRTGAQALPLLHGGRWTPEAIYGKSGEFRLSAEGARGLPVSDVALGYRFIGGKLRLRGETEIDPSVLDFANRGGPSAPHQVGSKAVGIDPMTVLTIFSVLNGIWQALHPTADLTLGGNVSCEAVLDGDNLAVKFTQAPVVRIVAWFTFNLGVSEVDVSESRVRVGFIGSRWVKERTFQVK